MTLSVSIFIEQNFELGFFTLIVCFFIVIILLLYLPVFDSLSQYQTLDLFKDKIVINKINTYPINEITCSIKDAWIATGKVTWKSCIFSDKDENMIGEFFFTIRFEQNFFDATPESLKQIIIDLQNGKDYNFNDYIKKDFQNFSDEKKSYNIALLILIGMFVIPAIIGIIFFVIMLK